MFTSRDEVDEEEKGQQHEGDSDPEDEQTFRGLLKNFVSNTTLHGIGRIFASTSRFRRIVWVLVCATLIVYAVTQCYQVVKEYQEHPIQITRSTKEDSAAEFPAVTLCNLNPLPNSEKLVAHSTWRPFLNVEKNNKFPKCGPEEQSAFGVPFHYSTMYGDVLGNDSAINDTTPWNENIDIRDLNSTYNSNMQFPPLPSDYNYDYLYDNSYSNNKDSDILPLRDWLNTGGYYGIQQNNKSQMPNIPGSGFSYSQADSNYTVLYDEYEAEIPECTRGQFQCPDGSCIPERWRCNRIIDCINAEDEANCSKLLYKCPMAQIFKL
ncbi:hypothetical protein SK128_022089 [Halocaridina rubra]|uniref:Uncharacterized protein n=1 Tax=Halocaridina rubra TaxID=373956 RepID=A0AAN8XIS0_HALRR